MAASVDRWCMAVVGRIAAVVEDKRAAGDITAAEDKPAAAAAQRNWMDCMDYKDPAQMRIHWNPSFPLNPYPWLEYPVWEVA